MSYIKFSTDRVELDLELKDKYMLISGFSGVGKSLLFEELSLLYDLDSDLIDSDLPVVLIRSKNDLSILRRLIGNIKCLVISDEVFAHRVIELVQDINVYCILISRKIYKQYNFSYRCLYRAVRDNDGVTRIYPKYILDEYFK